MSAEEMAIAAVDKASKADSGFGAEVPDGLRDVASAKWFDSPGRWTCKGA